MDTPKPDRTLLNDKIERFNIILDLMRLDQNNIKISNCQVVASVSIPLLKQKIEEIHNELTLQYELEVTAMRGE